MKTRMKGYTPEQFVQLLNANGWQYSRRSATHVTYVKPNNKNVVTVPYHEKEICRPLAKRLLKTAGIM